MSHVNVHGVKRRQARISSNIFCSYLVKTWYCAAYQWDSLKFWLPFPSLFTFSLYLPLINFLALCFTSVAHFGVFLYCLDFNHIFFRTSQEYFQCWLKRSVWLSREKGQGKILIRIGLHNSLIIVIIIKKRLIVNLCKKKKNCSCLYPVITILFLVCLKSP